MLVNGGKARSHTLRGQLGAGNITRIETTEEGTLFLEWDDESPPWRLQGGDWSPARLAPPFQPQPGEPGLHVAGDKESWYETHVMIGPGGTVFTASASAIGPSTRTTARWHHGKAEILGREISMLNPSGCFVTPDGTLWNAWFGELKRFIDGKWVAVAGLPGADQEGPRLEPTGDGGFGLVDNGLRIGYGLRAVGNDGPPWILQDRDESHLLRLAYAPDGKNPSVSLIRISEGDRALRVHDAIPWTRGELLLATDAGPRVYERSTGKLRPSPLPETDERGQAPLP